MWIFYALASFATVGVSNILDKVLVDTYIKESAIIPLFSGGIALVMGIGILIVRGFPLFSLEQTALIAISGILLTLYLIPYFKALEKEDASSVVPLFQFGSIFTLMLSYVFLNEPLTTSQLIGFTVIFAASLLITIEDLSTFKLRPSLFLMLLSSLLFAISSVLFRFIVVLNNMWDAIAYERLGVGLGAILLLLYPNFFQRFTRSTKAMVTPGWLSLAGSETFYIGSRLLYSFALASGPVALVSVLGGVHPLIVLGYEIGLRKCFPKQFPTPSDQSVTKKILGIAGIAAGLFLLYR